MLKRIFLSTLLLTISSMTFGAPYMGLSVGANHTNFHLLDDTWMGNTFEDISGTKPNINIFGGYGNLISTHIYLGAEVFFNETLGTMQGNYSVTTPAYPSLEYQTQTLEYQTRLSYGVNLIPGIMLSPNTMVYGRVGIVRTNFKISTTDTFYFDAETTSQTTNVSGTQGGLGLQTKLSDHLDIRGEYVYTKYSSFTTYGIESNPTSNQFNIGLVYQFA